MVRAAWKAAGVEVEWVPSTYACWPSTACLCRFSPAFPDIDRLVALFDQGLAKVRSSGEYASIEARWR